jgi:glycosyltransferase involved in cell wall biosynthesis
MAPMTPMTPVTARTAAFQPLQILIISEMSPPYTMGGGETRYGLLAPQLAALGHQVSWLSMRQKASPDAETIAGVRHLHRGPRLRQPPLRSMQAKLHFMGSLCWHLLRHRYDVVDCQTYAPLLAAWFICKLRRIPLMATIHDTGAAGPAGDQWLSDFDRRLARVVEGRLYRLGYDHVLTVSAAVKADLVDRFGVPPARVSVVPNRIDVLGITATQPDPQPADLLFVGRLIPHKHPADVLKVLAQLNAGRRQRGLPACRAKFVGGGPLADELKAQARLLGVSDCCIFCGEVPRHEDVIAHLRSARVLVLPSTREGFGLVLAEAMAAGAALAAYRIPAVEETVGPELTGCLVSAGDVDALTRLVQSLVEDPPRHAQLVDVGMKRVCAHFDARGFVVQVAGVYEQAMARRGRA